ncbi:MAG: class I SAM-dependent methyltransferase [Pseudoalteromonas spongiae]
MTFDSMWDTRFSNSEYAYGTQANDFLKQHVSSLKANKVLTLAEGEGRNAVFLAQQGFEVCAVDASIKGLEKAARLADKHKVNIEFIHADLTNFDLGENKWDSIISIFAPFSQAHRRLLHANVVKSLKPNGVFLLEAYTPEQIHLGTGGGNDISTMITTTQLKNELDGLDFTLLQSLKRTVIEGTFHTGEAAVIQAIARKSL